MIGQVFYNVSKNKNTGMVEMHVQETAKSMWKKENRFFGSTRESIILRHVNKKSLGLEIGPSHRPVAPKREGYNVKILDHLDSKGLKEKYKDHHINIDAIEEVDYVWNGEPLSKLTGKTKFDYIIASHVIEHTPDLIGFLNECEEMLTDNGILSLAIPDKRYCFDHFRELTSLSKMIDAHISKHTIHTQGTAAEYFLNVVKINEVIAWDKKTKGKYEFVHCFQNAVDVMKSIAEGIYVDLHAWCFTPSSFRLLINDLRLLNFLKFRELSFHDTMGHEFFITLSKTSPINTLDRMDLLVQKENSIH